MLLTCCLLNTYNNHSVCLVAISSPWSIFVVPVSSIFHFHYHFHINYSYNLINTDALVFFCTFFGYSLKSGPETWDPGPGIRDPDNQDIGNGTLGHGNLTPRALEVVP